jgi:hypothetical protein
LRNYRAAISVHKAQREAVNLLSGNGEAKLATVATVASVVAAANATAKEAAKSLQLSMKPAALAASSSQKKSKQTGPIMGDFELMQVCYLKPLNVTKGVTCMDLCHIKMFNLDLHCMDVITMWFVTISPFCV